MGFILSECGGFYLVLLNSCAYTPPMGETLEQILDKKKRVVLEKQSLIHSLLKELSSLVQDGDKLAIEGYFRLRGWGGGKSSFCAGLTEVASGIEESSAHSALPVSLASKGNRRGGALLYGDKMYAEMTKRDAVNHVLLRAARAMTTVEVYEELVKGGYPFSGKDPMAVFRTEIYKYADRAERGLFIVASDFARAHSKNGSGRWEAHEFEDGGVYREEFFEGRRWPVIIFESALDVAALEEGLGDFGGFGGLGVFGDSESWDKNEVSEVVEGAIGAEDVVEW
jgi:hypothetical protein